MISRKSFPRLNDDHYRITSPATSDYNCIAWSVHDTGRWWQPGDYWPRSVPEGEYGIAVLVEALRSLGFEECSDEAMESGFEKVAVYGNNLLYTHAARQLPSGKWTSKLGRAEDIEHDEPDDLAGGIYGEVVQIMKRTQTAPPQVG